MDCQRAEELFSDHREGTLHQILRAELEAHLARCAPCSELQDAFDEVVTALRACPDLEPPVGLSAKAARTALARVRRPALRPAIAVPSWLQAAAAGFALIALGTMLMVLGPERPTRAARRLVTQTVSAGSQLVERKDRLFEDVRILGVVLTTAFEGRIDRVNERVEDYRRLLERRRATSPPESSKGSETRPEPVGLASGFGTGPRPAA